MPVKTPASKSPRDPAHDVFDPVTPMPDDAPLTPAQEAELLRMESDAHAWPTVRAALREHLDDAAEGAKPDLARLSADVFARLDAGKQKAPEKQGVFTRLLDLVARYQPHAALAAAAAAIVLAVLPLAGDEDPVPVAQTGTQPAAPAAPEAFAAADELPTSVELRHIAFDNADGVVMQDPQTDSTIIWVNEYDGV